MFAAVASVEQPGRTKDDLRGTKLIIGYAAVAVFLLVSVALSVTQRPGRGSATGDRRLLHVGLPLSRRALHACPVGPVRGCQRGRRRQAAPRGRPADRNRRLCRRRLRGGRLRGLRQGAGHEALRHGRRGVGDCDLRGGAARAGHVGQAGEEAERRGDVRPVDARDRRGDPGCAPRRLVDREIPSAARHGRGAGGHPARADAARSGLARGQGLPLPAGYRAALIRGRPDRPRFLPLPGRDGARPEDPARPDRAGGVHLECERRAPDGARLPRRAADLRTALARRGLPALRALHGRRDVGHGLPGARPDPDRAADAEATCRGTRDGGRRDRRRDSVVPAGARGRHREQRGLIARAPGRRACRPVHGGDAAGRPAAPRSPLESLRRGGPGADALARRHLRRCAAVGVRRPADRDRGDLRVRSSWV